MATTVGWLTDTCYGQILQYNRGGGCNKHAVRRVAAQQLPPLTRNGEGKRGQGDAAMA